MGAMMHMYIITLINNNERMKNAIHIKNNLKNIFKVTIVSACIPKGDVRSDQDYDSTYRTKNLGFDLTAGELGCFKSHRTVWCDFLESGDDFCCVLEDDAVLKPDFLSAVSAAILCKEKWDLCRLHCSFYSNVRVTVCTPPGYVLCYDVIPPRGTTGYLLSRKAAEIFLQESLPIREPVDHFVDNVRVHGLTVLSLRPHPVSVMDVLPSEIGRRGWDVTTRGKRTLWRRMQRDLINFTEQVFCFKKALTLVHVKLTHNPLSKNSGNGL